MKKNFLKVLIALLAVNMFSSCRKQLDVNPRGRITEANYYSKPSDALEALISVYDVVGNQSGGYLTKVNILSAACDDHYAGGDSPSDIADLQTINNYTLTSTSGAASHLWNKGFTGVYRANVFLSKIEGITGLNATTKSRYVAEVKALRAFFYFDLVKLFKNCPLLLLPVEPDKLFDVEQVPADQIYAQVIKDLTEAMPNLPVTVPAASEGGRLTQGAAHAILGKVYMWQQKWTEAAAEFALVNGPSPGNSQYGYRLLTNYADLWNWKNKFNSESILEIVYNTTSNMGWGNVGSGEGNVMSILVGPRNYVPVIAAQAPDYISGWSFLPFTQEFFDLIHYDPRNKPTVANLDSLEKAGIVTYKHANANTGYFIEKYAGRVSTKASIGQLELNFGQDMYEIRLADTYMLEAEALLKSGAGVGAGSKAYVMFNAVRARVGLNPLPVTMENIMKERRLELAAEGHRWFDLVRWGLAPTVLASKGFIANKNEILPIPQQDLSNTKIKQSKEWGGTL
ncbi:RagB/SusD family nutrient uptake outer membrane protein [Pedobacter chinensis]|uniref:RagB/SusD family nutrient uptake outer membrane protein n=1 Tax=Pedobacter chinensis TaxID=2282421 RepID=A0A369PY41_9SPHI|nr:RagB/SusD family nutrient uptake outer membrane protein [Pedobacter chinensis]RDC55008.1 RagB/SusD family nutrient uptake outer membrane protein [Pedobacter chinensis]